MPKRKSSPTQRPARVLVECSPHRITGGTSIKELSDNHIEHESHIEFHAIATLSLCHDVLGMDSQATKEEYWDGDVKRIHTPDFQVKTFQHPRLLVEVKSLEHFIQSSKLQKYLHIARHYRQRQQPFVFLVDAQLEHEPRFSSVILLSRYVTSKVPEVAVSHATSALESGPLSIFELMEKACLELVDIYTLIARRTICFDWSKTLDQNTSVSLPNQPYKGLQLDDILNSTRHSGLLAELALGCEPTDKRLLADAAAWRQSHCPLSPFNFVGGFSGQPPLRDLRNEEHSPRAPWRRRNFAPGCAAFATKTSGEK